MSFISKIELKSQLQKMGIKTEGNYIKKCDLKRILAENSVDVIPIEIKFKIITNKSDLDKDTSKDLEDKLWESGAKQIEGPWSGQYETIFDIDEDQNISTFVEKKKKEINKAITEILK